MKQDRETEESIDFASNLTGTWQSDWPRTKRHIDAECKLTEENMIGLELFMGKMTIRYEETRVVFTMPEIRFRKEGKERVLESWSFEEPINVLDQTDSQIALLSSAWTSHLGEADFINIITFESADTFWLYMGHSPFVDLHVREYFSRIEPS
ncbi:hypothetical protein [Gimesia sp.]|uniref:hypothetical protein n=1 Tax=Gimesia sp. TaxID=2024833 RepID=UPI0032EDB76C